MTKRRKKGKKKVKQKSSSALYILVIPLRVWIHGVLFVVLVKRQTDYMLLASLCDATIVAE